GPDHAVEARDALADDVEIGGPEALEASFGESGGGQIVDQGVEPYVHGLLWTAGEGNAPGLALPRDRDVLQPGLEQSHYFVAADLGLDRERAGADALEHRVAVRAQPEAALAPPRRGQSDR